MMIVVILIPLVVAAVLVIVLSQMAGPPINQVLMDRLQRGRGEQPLYPDPMKPGSDELMGSWKGTSFGVRCPFARKDVTAVTVTVPLKPWPQERVLPEEAFWEAAHPSTHFMPSQGRQLLPERMWEDLAVHVEDGVLTARYSITDNSTASVWRLLRWAVVTAQMLEVAGQESPDWLQERCLDQDAPREVRWVAGWQLMDVAPERADGLLGSGEGELRLTGLEAMAAPPMEKVLALALDGWQAMPLRLRALALVQRHHVASGDPSEQRVVQESLNKLLRGPSHSLFVAALQLLAHAAVPRLDFLARRFAELPPDARIAIARVCLAHGDDGFMWALERLEDVSQPPQVQLALLESVLARRDPSVLPTLMRLLPGRAPQWRKEVLAFREAHGRSSDGGLALAEEDGEVEGGLSLNSHGGELAVTS